MEPPSIMISCTLIFLAKDSAPTAAIAYVSSASYSQYFFSAAIWVLILNNHLYCVLILVFRRVHPVLFAMCFLYFTQWPVFCTNSWTYAAAFSEAEQVVFLSFLLHFSDFVSTMWWWNIALGLYPKLVGSTSVHSEAKVTNFKSPFVLSLRRFPESI